MGVQFRGRYDKKMIQNCKIPSSQSYDTKDNDVKNIGEYFCKIFLNTFCEFLLLNQKNVIVEYLFHHIKIFNLKYRHCIDNWNAFNISWDTKVGQVFYSPRYHASSHTHTHSILARIRLVSLIKNKQKCYSCAVHKYHKLVHCPLMNFAGMPQFVDRSYRSWSALWRGFDRKASPASYENSVVELNSQKKPRLLPREKATKTNKHIPKTPRSSGWEMLG